ncbi:MAG TPA: hypothetical protein VK803_02765 [Steroidobacteraceae bacterium]|jgi:hypothetical protein|nr:hypothetical protein [Steroidobacteraceae bacterium]
MDQAKTAAWYRTGVTIFVAAMLLAQAATLPVTATHSTFLRDRAYPILEYPMYAPAHYEGERVTASWLLEGVLADGRTISISTEQLHVDIFEFVNIVQAGLHGNATALGTLRELIRAHVPAAEQIRQLRIKNYPIKVTRDGPQSLPAEVVMTIALQPAS